MTGNSTQGRAMSEGARKRIRDIEMERERAGADPDTDASELMDKYAPVTPEPHMSGFSNRHPNLAAAFAGATCVAGAACYLGIIGTGVTTAFNQPPAYQFGIAMLSISALTAVGVAEFRLLKKLSP
jgi:hypothetical protein